MRNSKGKPGPPRIHPAEDGGGDGGLALRGGAATTTGGGVAPEPSPRRGWRWPWARRRSPVPSEETFPATADTPEWRRLPLTLAPLIERQELRSLLIASAQPGEGRTTVAVELATALTEGLDQRVLLIDAHVRRPRLHALFDCAQSPGLSNVWQEEVDLPEVIRETFRERLFVLPAGTPPLRPTELFTLQRIERLVAQTQAQFELVILEAPPLGLFAEGLLLSRCVDGVLLVVLAGVTSGEAVREAQATIQRAQGRLLGVVINNRRGEYAP